MGSAVKVTVVPEQTLLAEAEMLTLTGKSGIVVMITVFETAGLPETQLTMDD